MKNSETSTEVLLPEVIGERCVHSLAEQATCRACVDACPVSAWVIDDERLGIDEDRCDGCGLCAPACPQGAIVERYAPVRYRLDGSELAFAACSQTGAETAGPGLLPCLHVLGLHRLLQLRLEGVQRLLLTREDCDACPRGGVVRIDSELQRLAGLRIDRGLPPLAADFLSPAAWSRARVAARARHRPPTLSRRDLFRRATRTLAERIERAEDSETGVPPFVPPGRLLSRTDPAQVAIHAPRIDPRRCTGCDTCARLCPQGAIAVEPDAYRLDADACTGCGLCRDLCSAGAAEIEHFQPSPQRQVSLAQHRCRSCGVAFHSPAEGADPGGLCPICAVTGHHARLFQVLP
jgi:ferredoxin